MLADNTSQQANIISTVFVIFCWGGGGYTFGREKSRSSKDGSGLSKVPPNSAEPLGFCRKVLQNVSHGKKPVEERFCRTPKVLQNPKGSAELWEPSPAFQALQILLPTLHLELR